MTSAVAAISGNGARRSRKLDADADVLADILIVPLFFGPPQLATTCPLWAS
jgi:hypothetical protein